MSDDWLRLDQTIDNAADTIRERAQIAIECARRDAFEEAARVCEERAERSADDDISLQATCRACAKAIRARR